MSTSACRTTSATTSATLRLITGKPHAVSTDRHLLVFGEEMRSTIYGHMQFFGINRLVQPQYTGFDGTPNRNDFPANYVMAADAVRQGGVVTYGHPIFAGQPFPFDKEPAKPSAAARELPIDAVLGMVHAVDLMSYNSDKDRFGRTVVSVVELRAEALGVRRHRRASRSFDRPARRRPCLREDPRVRSRCRAGSTV